MVCVVPSRTLVLSAAGANPVEGATYTGFKEEQLAKLLETGDTKACNFFRLLAVCHTIQPEEINGRIEYQAQSPDEKALTEAARCDGLAKRAAGPIRAGTWGLCLRRARSCACRSR